MHHISRSEGPEKLKEYHKSHTQHWVEYYESKKEEKGRTVAIGQNKNKKGLSQPKDHKWTEPEIREPLIAEFDDNCAYCGISMGRGDSKKARDLAEEIAVQKCISESLKDDQSLQEMEENYKKICDSLPQGEVDHFIPKSKAPHKVYEWKNYMWSCTLCNTKKSADYDPNFPLLNPSEINDMNLLEMRVDGNYHLRAKFQKDPTLVRRYERTKRLINISGRPKARKCCREEIQIILGEIKRYNQFSKIKAHSPLKLDFIKKIQSKCEELEMILKDEDYRKMKCSIIHQWASTNGALIQVFRKYGILHAIKPIKFRKSLNERGG